MEILLTVLVAAAGVCAPVQAGVNAQLARWTGDSAMASMVSFAVGTVVLLAYVLAARIPWPPLETVGRVHWWLWTGGLMGAFIVFATVVAAPRLGAATMIACFVASMMLASLVLDHFGLAGYEVRRVTALRALGAVLLISGVALIRDW